MPISAGSVFRYISSRRRVYMCVDTVRVVVQLLFFLQHFFLFFGGFKRNIHKFLLPPSRKEKKRDITHVIHGKAPIK